MNINIAKLVFDYQSSVRMAVHLMGAFGIKRPLSARDWAQTEIPSRGVLEGGVEYFKNGYGCSIYLSSGMVDFDFGDNGEIEGVDLWRLFNFAGSRLMSYGFSDMGALEESFCDAVNVGSLVYSGYILYYVADSVTLLADDVLDVWEGDALPHRERDAILALYVQCFLAADLMRDNYKKLDNQLESKGRLSQRNFINWRIYLSSWLGYLHTTCEGFQKLSVRRMLSRKRPEIFRELIPKCDAIGRIEKRHRDALRVLRNNIFHLRSDKKAIEEFFDAGGVRFAWADELHGAIEDLLSEYIILCEVHYFSNDRLEESQIRRAGSRRC